MAIQLIEEAYINGARKHKACGVLGISIRTLERWECDGGDIDKRKCAVRTVGNKLSDKERQQVIAIANNAKYKDLPPSKIVPSLADEGLYIASEATFYRILREEKQLAHRHASNAPKHKKPAELKASLPNQVWAWDITFLPSQVRGQFFYLYAIVDVYSRKIVGWSVHENQSSDHASALIKEACHDEDAGQDQVVLHSDNGKPMKGATMLAMLQKLGVMPSFSRPGVSDDNPYAESFFKTVKYHPTFPATDKFETIEDARKWCIQFIDWYNSHHMHSGLKFMTPSQRHNGEDIAIVKKRNAVYEQAKAQRPDRWSGSTRNWSLPETVILNPSNNENRNTGKNKEKLSKAA